MKLPLLFKIFAVLHVLMGIMMLFGGSMLSATNGWEHSVGIATMAEHHGASLLGVSILFWMLPRWLTGIDLKQTVPTAILVQAILVIMPIYHMANGAIPSNDPATYIFVAILIILMGLFYFAANKEEVAD